MVKYTDGISYVGTLNTGAWRANVVTDVGDATSLTLISLIGDVASLSVVVTPTYERANIAEPGMKQP